MSGLRAVAASNANNTGTATKTLVLVSAPANTGLKITKWGCHFGGISPTAGKIDVETLLAASGGTGTTLTPRKRDGHSGSVQSTSKEDYSAEPSGGTVIDSKLIHPQSGIEQPMDLIIPPGGSFSIRVTAAASVESRAFVEFEE